MKKIACLLLALLAITAITYAQGLYYRVGLGYAIPNAGQLNDGNGYPYNGTIGNANSSLQTYKINNASFSSGVQSSIAAGYMFNKNAGFDLAIGSVLAAKKYTFTAGNVSVGGISSDFSQVQQVKAPMFLIPSAVLQTEAGNMDFYLRVGVVLPLRTRFTQDQIITNLPGTGALTTNDFTFEIKNNFALGFAAAAGLKYKMNGRTSLWGELGFMSLSVTAKQGNLVAATQNGQQIDLDYVSGAKVVNYSKSVVVDSTGTQLPTFSIPFSNVGIHIGLSYDLGDNARPSRGKNDIKDRRKKF